MRRREFIAAIAGLAAWPVSTHAQQAAKAIVGFLNSASPDNYAHRAAAFRTGLGELGFIDGENIKIEYRWAAGEYARLPEMAADLVRQGAAVIAVNTPAIISAKQATSVIPVVFFTATDPIEAGFVTSLNRPGGNLTGISALQAEAGPKRLELLHEVLPQAVTFWLLVNPHNVALTERLTRDTAARARSLGLELHVLHASTQSDLDAAFTRLAAVPGTPLVIGADAFLVSQTQALARLSLRHAVPTIFEDREFPEAGGLMSYGSNANENFRQLGLYAARILKGEKPADLPVQQSTRLELVINLKTAHALGITVPRTLVARADEVIE